MTDPSKGASSAAIQFHYDVGDDFYRLWLDDSMTYSCGMFDGRDRTLEDAQRHKHDYWLRNLRLDGGARLLDVGCGWGAMLSAARRSIPDLDGTGLTLSRTQADHVRRAQPAISVRLEAWQDHQPETEGYDAVIAIGSFEHFARPGLPRSQRVEVYAGFFRRAFEWTTDGARVGVQTIALEDEDEHTTSGLGRYFTYEVFPESSLPRVSEIIDASERYFRLVEFRTDPDDYAITCREWRRRLHSRREEAMSLVGREVVHRYRTMQLLAEVQFTRRNWTLCRMVFERRGAEVTRKRYEADPLAADIDC